MQNYKAHLILKGSSVKQALAMLNELSKDAILFVVDNNDKLIGSITDGDIRRGLLNDFSVDSIIDKIIQPKPHYVIKGQNDIYKIIKYRDENYKILPVLDEQSIIVDIINFRKIKSYLPIDAVIMAGGRGERLKPLTDLVPKPLLKIGKKPIMEHNLDHLITYGIVNFWVSVNYLGNQVEDYFGSGKNKNIKIEYVWESSPLGTIGAVSKINNFLHDYVLVTNSDLLTNIDYEQFFLDFVDSNADFSVATIPYNVNVPYAILETTDKIIKSFKEKPRYTYFANAGIYLMKRSIVKEIPINQPYNSTDLLDCLIKKNFNVRSFPLRGYWLDIGKHDDFNKAQEDINYIKF